VLACLWSWEKLKQLEKFEIIAAKTMPTGLNIHPLSYGIGESKTSVRFLGKNGVPDDGGIDEGDFVVALGCQRN